MSPPDFNDLGKEARDVLNKNYHLGVVKLDFKKKTPIGIDFNINGVSNNDTGKVTTFLETKHGLKKHGLTIKEKWNADNTFSTDISIKDGYYKGTDLGVNCFFAPSTGHKRAVFKSSFKNDVFNFKNNFHLSAVSSELDSSFVIQNQNFAGGMQTIYDTYNSALTGHQFAMAYKTPEFVLHTSLKNQTDLVASYYQKICPKLQTGLTIDYKKGSNESKFNFGIVYNLEKSTLLRAKVNNNSQVGLGLTHKLTDGVDMTLSALIDSKSLNQGGHKLGLGLEFNL